MTDHLSALALDAQALEALPGDAAAHLAGCATCQARAAEAGALRAELPPYVMVRTLERVRRRRRGFTLALLAPLALAAVAVAMWPRAEVSEPELAIKGGPELQIYARRDGHVFAVVDGAALAAGDEIRFAVTPAGAGHVLIASVDGAGHATIYVPYAGERSVAVDPAARSELPGSIVLDDAPGPERVFAIFARAPIRAAEVEPALARLAADGPDRLREAARLELAFPATQASLRFEKVAP